MIHLVCSESRQEIKAEVFNYQQINKMETINSIRQFCNEGPVMVKTEHRRAAPLFLPLRETKLFEIVAKFVLCSCSCPAAGQHQAKRRSAQRKKSNRNPTIKHNNQPRKGCVPFIK